MFPLHRKTFSALTVGFAMFSMFFGAGNIVFPLTIGLLPEGGFVALLGFLLTAVCVPFLGLMTMTLFDGDYTAFFNRLGKQVGPLVILLILLIMGPFGALPRCITASFATVNIVLPYFSLPLFSLLSLVLVFFLSIKSQNVLKILGLFLTPLLIISLGLIVTLGFFMSGNAVPSLSGSLASFGEGALVGYNTMDLIASFFFASVVILAMKKSLSHDLHSRKEHLLLFHATYIGASLLTLVYISFTFLSLHHASSLEGIAQADLLGTLTTHILGIGAAPLVAIAVFFACLTTEIALAVIFAEYLHYTLFKGRISYRTSLVATLLIAFCISTLRFEGISVFLGPILHLCYPSLIMLTLCNACYKLFHFKPVKVYVLATFVITLFLTYR